MSVLTRSSSSFLLVLEMKTRRTIRGKTNRVHGPNGQTDTSDDGGCSDDMVSDLTHSTGVDKTLMEQQ